MAAPERMAAFTAYKNFTALLDINI